MERCTRGAKAVEEVFLERMAILFSPLRRGGFLQNPDLLGFRTLRGRRVTLAWTRTTRSGARGLLVDSMACAVAVRFVDEVGVEEDDAEAAARSRRAMELCTRGAKAVAEVFLERIAILFSPLRREGSWRNTLAWTRATRSGARGFLVDSMACAVAVRFVDEVETSPLAMERCTRGAKAVAEVFLDR